MGTRNSITAAFLFAVLLAALLAAQPAQAAAKNYGTFSTFNIGVYSQSLLEKHGVIFYDDWDITPTISLFFFDDRLEFLGNSIGYRDFVIPDQLRLRTKFNYVSDDPTYPARKDRRNSFVNRENTYEIVNTVEWFAPSYSDDYRTEIDLNWSWDVKENHGHYVDVLSKVKITDFDMFGTKIEPQVFASVGWGQKEHNMYYYGPTADEDGFNNLNYGFWLTLPDLADRYYPIILLSHFEVLGDKNKNAAFAKGNNEGYLVSLIASVGFLE